MAMTVKDKMKNASHSQKALQMFYGERNSSSVLDFNDVKNTEVTHC